MRRRELLAGAAAATVPWLAGCGGGQVETIEVGNGTTDPLRLFTGPQVSVEFVSIDGESHTIVPESFNGVSQDWTQEDPGGVAAPDDPYETTFPSQGIFHYFCEDHGEEAECGGVVVGAESSPIEDTLPCE